MMIDKILLILFSIGTMSLSAQIAASAEEISPLLIGETIPNTELVGISGRKEMAANILSRQKTIMLFYRGGWCPYCNSHLAELGQAEAEILDLGYQIVAISPDAPEQLAISAEKNQLGYHLYSDGNGSFTQAMGLAFKAPDRYANMLEKYSASQNPGLLPVPSVFVLDTNGTILFEYICPNYKQRMDANLLIAVLKELNKSNFEE